MRIFVDVERLPIGRVASIREHRILEVAAVLRALAIQIIEAPDEGNLRRELGSDMAVEIHICFVYALLEAIGIMRHAIVCKALAKKAAHIAVVGGSNRESGTPLAQARRHHIAERKLGAILIVLRAARIVVGVQRYPRRQHAILDRVRAARILAYQRGIKIETQLAAADIARAAVQQMRAIKACTVTS